MPLEEAFTNKFISGSKAELQPKIDIELQLPSQHSDAELKVYAQALKLGDIELLRKMLIVSEEVLRAGKSAQQRGNEEARTVVLGRANEDWQPSHPRLPTASLSC